MNEPMRAAPVLAVDPDPRAALGALEAFDLFDVVPVVLRRWTCTARRSR